MSEKRHKPIRRICCIGAGYVGGPTSAVIAHKAPHIHVDVVDLSEKRIAAWNSNHLPIYEPGLQAITELPRDGAVGRLPNLVFTTDVKNSIAQADLIFLCVATPTKYTGTGAGRAADLVYVESATRMIAEAAESDKIVVEKSTVPCKTAASIREILSAAGRPWVHFDILSNPEFLAEGTAIKNLLEPDRLLIGSLTNERGLQAAASLVDVYAEWVPRERIVTMHLWSSEMAKLAANALLAQRISSINALSAICESTGADIDEVAYAVGLDKRIGPKMLKSSVGFGGSCFRKDVLNLVYIAQTLHLPEVATYWEKVVEMNEYQKDRFCKRIVSCLHTTLTNKRVAILGFAYKKDTGDTRESAAISLVTNLVAEQAHVRIYDPKVEEESIWMELKWAAQNFEETKKRVTVCKTAYEACEGSHAAIIATEWDEFNNKDTEVNWREVNGLALISNSPSSSNMYRTGSGTQFSNGTLETSPAPNERINGAAPAARAGEPNPARDGEVRKWMASHDNTVINGCGSSGFVGDELKNGYGEMKQATIRERQPRDEKVRRMDWRHVASILRKPMFVFDGRNVVDAVKLEALGFRVESIGKPSLAMRS
ncbi:UDP-glucose 6-dehydrogenase 1 [Puttea exsequens]|nr:UDP-glucose 6-dehydrogenase 1 [Puttea exsequens]